jgi:hypothetical protein
MPLRRLLLRQLRGHRRHLRLHGRHLRPLRVQRVLLLAHHLLVLLLRLAGMLPVLLRLAGLLCLCR